MAVVPILITGDPVLHRPASAVSRFDDGLARLVTDLRETMAAAPGVGLAAPQIGVDARVFVYEWRDDAGREHRGVAVNPEIWVSPASTAALDEETESEGCLSVPGERYPLRRSDRALLRAQDLAGEPYEREADGWLARILQHEFDHLDGILYTDRLAAPHGRQAARQCKRRGWGEPGVSWLPGVDALEG